MLYAWLERLLAQRRTREILFAVFILVMVCFQFSGMIVQRWAKPVGAFMHETSYIWSTLPTGQAGVALQFFLDRSTGPGLLACAIVLAYSAGFAGLLAYRLHAEYLGETFSETAAPTRIAKKVSAAPRAITAAPTASQNVSAGSTWFSGPVSAIFIKEIRYLYRNSIAAVSLLMPLIIVGAITMNSRAATHGKPNPFSKMIPSGLAYPGAVAYSLLILVAVLDEQPRVRGRRRTVSVFGANRVQHGDAGQKSFSTGDTWPRGCFGVDIDCDARGATTVCHASFHVDRSSFCCADQHDGRQLALAAVSAEIRIRNENAARLRIVVSRFLRFVFQHPRCGVGNWTAGCVAGRDLVRASCVCGAQHRGALRLFALAQGYLSASD